MTSGNRVELLCGPPRSGKTTTALALYAAQVADYGEDTALLLLPTARVVRRAREQLLEAHLSRLALLDPRIFTFPQLAQLLLNANHECATAMDIGTRRLILEEVIRDLASTGKITALEEVSRLPGFTSALAELISDLKRAAVDPRRFCEALKQAGLTQTMHKEVAALYCAYQWLLLSTRRFDEEGLFWLARDLLRDGRRRPLERVQLLIVDGFSDFTTTQLDVLELLAAQIPRTVITMDYADGDPREALGPWLQDTLRRIKSRFPEAHVSFRPERSGDDPLCHLRARLFSLGGSPKADARRRIHILKCPSPSEEVREVLARVKIMLADGHVRPDEVVIVVRDLSERSEEIRSMAMRMGVPVYVDAPVSPRSCPAVREILHVYQTVLRGYQCADVLALLRSSLFTFEPLIRRSLNAEDVANCAVKARVIEGRQEWLERVRKWGESDAVADALEEIFALFPNPDVSSRIETRINELRDLLYHTNVWHNAARADLAPHSSANLWALGQLEQAADEIEHVGRLSDKFTSVSLAEFYALLRQTLDDLAQPPASLAGNWVLVLEPRQVRELRFAVTFVMGLREGEFPRRPPEQPFFSDDELSRLARAGTTLERRRGSEGQEPMVFYETLCSAEQELWLSFAAADADGKALQPSPYLDEVRRLFNEHTLDETTIPLSRVVPSAEHVTEVHELVQRAIFDLTANEEGKSSSAAYDALVSLRVSPGTLDHVVRAMELEQLRDSFTPRGPFVGELTGSAAEAVGETLGAEHDFSATEVNSYASCPFGYFCEHVLQLTEPGYASPDVDPMLAGKVRHQILAAFAQAAQRRRQPLVRPGEEEAVTGIIEDIIATVYEDAVRRGEVSDETLWRLDQERCKRELAAWVRWEAENFHDHALLAAEQGFGRKKGWQVRLPGRPDISFTGRIDRVDLVRKEYVLIDYKSGSIPTAKDMQAGRDLTFAIYSLGAEATLQAVKELSCGGWCYCSLRRPISKAELTGYERITAARANCEAQISTLIDSMRAGWFSYARISSCADSCMWHHVCRHRPRPGDTRQVES